MYAEMGVPDSPCSYLLQSSCQYRAAEKLIRFLQCPLDVCMSMQTWVYLQTHATTISSQAAFIERWKRFWDVCSVYATVQVHILLSEISRGAP